MAIKASNDGGLWGMENGGLFSGNLCFWLAESFREVVGAGNRASLSLPYLAVFDLFAKLGEVCRSEFSKIYFLCVN